MPPINFVSILCVFSLIWACAGCSSSFNYAGLGNLRRLAQNQGQKASYLRRQQALFDRLSRDVEAKRLKEGVSKRTILARYGEPARAFTISASTGQESCLVYHHPTDYSSAAQYALYLDARGALTRIGHQTSSP